MKKADSNCENIPFFKDWNPAEGGSFDAGMNWILHNLGPRPNKKWSLDIVNHALGFVPGNLRWANRKEQRRNQQHRTLGLIPDDIFAIEAKRRGYKKVLDFKPQI